MGLKFIEKREKNEVKKKKRKVPSQAFSLSTVLVSILH